MKIDKLDSKQMPQVIGLGVITVGLFGWAAFSLLGGLSPAPAPSSAAKGEKTVAAAAHPDRPGVQVTQNSVTPASLSPGAAAVTGTAPGAPGAAAGLPGLVGSQYNPDPFRSPMNKAAAATAAKQVEAPKQPVAKAAATAKAAAPISAPPLPNLSARAPQWAGAAPAGFAPVTAAPAPVQPPKPVRPELQVTGVIAGEGIKEMATVRLGSEERIVQVGDRVSDATAYKVRKIAADGLVLASGKDSFFVALGAKQLAAKEAGK